jgi:hypothetical protein
LLIHRVCARVLELMREAVYAYEPFAPPVTSVTSLFKVARPLHSAIDSLNFLLSRRAAERIPRDARIWIAGCGATQAALIALTFPEAHILATDTSASALATARQLLAQLGPLNVELEQRDLIEVGRRDEFDLVFSREALCSAEFTAVERALKPTGVASMMVYNARNCRGEELFELLDRAQLRLVGCMPPSRWELSDLVDDEAILRRLAGMSPRDQVCFIQDVSDERSPWFHFYAQKASAPPVRAYSPEELMRLTYSPVDDYTVYSIRGSRIEPVAILPPFLERDGAVVPQAFSDRAAMDVEVELPETVLPILESCRGGASGATLVERMAPRLPKAKVLSLLRDLCSPFRGLLHAAPA